MNGWRLSLAPHKCAYTIFSKNKRSNTEPGFNLKLYSQEIPRDNHPTFLGLKFDPLLSMNKHMEYVTEKAKDRLNVLRILSYYESWRINKKILVNIYISLTRSIFEYMAFIYDKLASHHRDKLNAIQNNALRIIFKKKRDECTIDELHKLAGIPSLEIRLKMLTNNYYAKALSTNNPIIEELVKECNIFYKNLQIDENLANQDFTLEMIMAENDIIAQGIKDNPITLLCHIDRLSFKLWQ